MASRIRFDWQCECHRQPLWVLGSATLIKKTNLSNGSKTKSSITNSVHNTHAQAHNSAWALLVTATASVTMHDEHADQFLISRGLVTRGKFILNVIDQFINLTYLINETLKWIFVKFLSID